MNLVRIWTIAFNGFQEVIRDRILYIIGFFALLLIFAQRLLPEIAVGTDEKIFLDFGLGSIDILGAIVAIFVGTTLINKEIEKKTVLVLIPKPISSSEFIIGKHLGLTAVLTVMVTVMTAIYLLMLSLANISYPLNSILISLFFLLIQLSLIIAIALTFGVFTSSILATLLSFGVYLMGNFSSDLLQLGKISQNENIKVLTETLYLILPDLSRLNLKNEAVYNLLPNTNELIQHGLYGILYTIVLLTITIIIFSRRQF
jgi:ABC-type transport system involved in multi-copper enzyme maturation permease subunit